MVKKHTKIEELNQIKQNQEKLDKDKARKKRNIDRTRDIAK